MGQGDSSEDGKIAKFKIFGGRVKGRMGFWMDGRTAGWMDGRVDGWMWGV